MNACGHRCLRLLALALLGTWPGGCDRPVPPPDALEEAAARIEHGMEDAIRRPRHPVVSLGELNRPLEFDKRSGFQQLPLEGDGFYHFQGLDPVGTDAWGRPATIQCIRDSGRRWAEEHPDRPRIGVGDISRRLGGRFLPHRSHRDGRDVDLRPMTRRGERKVHVHHRGYSSEWTSDLIAILLDTCDVQVIYFNDRKLIRRFAKVRHSRGHNDHLHMRVRAPKAKRVQSSRAPAPAGDVAKR